MRKNEQAPAEANFILKVPYYAKHFFLTIIRVSALSVKATEIEVLKSSSFWKAAANNTDFRKLSLYDVTKAPNTALVA